jgi:hypothetical protein
VNFGSVAINEPSALQTVTLKNTEKVAINLTSLAVSPAVYSIAPSPGTTCSTSAALVAGASCAIGLTLTPSSIGAQAAGTLTIKSTATNPTLTVGLSWTGIAATTLSATSLAFGNAVVSEKSAIKSVTLKNNQLIALNIKSLALPAGSPYAVDPSSTCVSGVPVAGGASCTIAVTLTPPALGSQTGTLTINDDAPNTGQTVALSGTGIAATTLSATSLAFGNVATGNTSAIKSVSLKNNQLFALNIKSLALPAGSPYAVDPSSTCVVGVPVAAGASCNLAVVFKPTAIGSQPGTLTINDDAPNTGQTVSLTGTGFAPTTLSATTLAFGNMVLGQKSPIKSVTLKNNQLVALSFSSLVFSGSAGFALDPSTTCSTTSALGAGLSCTLAVTFTPPASASGLGAQSGTLTINDNAGNSGQTVTLTGTGTIQAALSVPSLTFAAQFLGTTSAAKTVTVTNYQSVPLTISSVTISGANSGDFGVTTTCPTAPSGLPAVSNCPLSVTFTPRASGTRTATLTVTDSGYGSPRTVTLTGPGNAPVTITPASITSFTAAVGSTSAYKAITIKNAQTTQALHIGSVQFRGDFAQTSTTCGSTLPYTLAAGASCNVNASFAPTIGGTRSGQVLVYDDTVTSPQVVNLSGSGTSPLTISATSLTFTAQKLGTLSPPKNIVLTNHEVQPETFTLATAGNFTATSNCTTGIVPANSACIVSVVFAPSATAKVGPLTGSLTITHSAAVGSPLTVALTGSASATNPAAAVAVVAPGAGAAGTTVPVVITGNGYTHFSSSSVITFADTASGTIPSGISVTGFTAVSANQINATLSIAGGSSVVYGARNITVKTGTEVATLLSAFIIASPSNAHSISGVTPGLGTQGQTLNVALAATGTHFVQGTTFANFGDGVTVNYLSVSDATDAQANITISNTTPVGYRTVTLVTGGEYASSSSTGFQILPNSAALLSISPNSAPQGTNPNVSITASGTHFLQNATQLSLTGGITAGAVTVTSPTTATASLIVPANASIGVQNATVSTGGEIASLANAFTVTGATPYLASVTPSSGQQGQTENVEIIGSLTNFNAANLVADFTGEITVNSITVKSPTDVVVNIAISQFANAGAITARLTSGPTGSATIFPFTFIVTPSNASIVSVTPDSAPQGSQVTLAVTGSNTNWVQGTTSSTIWYESWAGFLWTIPVDEVTINSPTSATLNIAVPSNDPAAVFTLDMSTGGQVISTPFTVTAATPSLTVSPANGLPGASFSVSFIGEFTHFSQAGTLPVVSGQGVTLTNFTVTSPVSATAKLVIDPAAASGCWPGGPGLRTITFTTGGEIVNTLFCVGASSLKNLSPFDSPPSTTLDVAITGVNTHFASGTTQVLFGPQITVNSVTVFSPTQLTANITTSYLNGSVLTPSPSGWQSVYVNTGSEQVIGGFLVDYPAFLSVSPSSAAQGSTENVTITGSLTNWVQGQTQAILGAGVTVANLTITGPTTATATISVSPTAPLGGNTVVMITGTEIESGIGFTVTPSAAQIVSVLPPGCSAVNGTLTCNGVSIPGATLPWQVMQLQTLSLNLTGVGTHWLQGGTSVSFGSGVVVDSLTVNSPTTATVQITVLSNSPVGYASVTTSTDGEVVTLQQGIDIEEGYPALLATSPGGGEQGATMNLQILGRYTHWQQGVTTAAFNQDIAVNSITVTDSDSAIVNITVSPLAYVDTVCLPWPSNHTITITTGSEQVSLPGTFCVTQGAAEITNVNPSTGLQQTTETVTVTGSATHFKQGVTTANFGTGINVSNVTVSGPTSATVALAITNAAPTGFTTVTMTTLGEVATQQYGFRVGPTVATLNEAIPNQAEQGVQNLNVHLIGQYSHFSSLSTATFGAGITVNSVTYTDATDLIANISIDPLSFAGTRTVTVTTPQVPCNILVGTPNACPVGAKTGSEILSQSAFTIIPGPAIISQVAPGTGNQGQEVVFNITGANTHWAQNFTQFWIPGAGSDMTINSVIVNSPTSATVDLSISPTANPGARSIFMVTAGEALTDRGAFVITGGIPVITYLSPNSATPGTTALEVDIHGLFTMWNATSTVNFGPGITVSTFQVDDSTHIEAVINVDPAAQLGYRTVQVQTGTQVLSGNFQIVAQPPAPTPSIYNFWPTSGLPGQTFNISFTGYYTHWDPTPVTGTQASFGSGIQVNSFQILGPASALANVTITATAAQTNLIVFTTGTEVETVDFSVVLAQPILSIVDPGSGMQGAQGLSVNIIGQYTTFDSTTTFSFGPGITVNGPPTILGPTIATQNIGVNQLASLGQHSVVANTPDASASAQVVGGAYFTVTPSLASISAISPNTALQGSTIAVEVTGQNTHWSSATTFQFGAGIVVTGATVNSSTDATLTLSIPALAPLGPGNVTAQTAGEIATLANGFVVQPGTPLLLSSGPTSLPQQSSAIFTILSQATQWSAVNPPTVSYGPGIVLTNIAVTGPTSMTVSGYVQPTTNVGWRNLTVSYGVQILGLSNAFYVNPGPAAINSVSASSAGQGATLTVTINGTNTNWVQGVTQLSFPGVLINSFTVNNANTITANITVSDYAPAGQVTVTATTLGEVATGTNVFTIIQTQPELLSVNAPSAAQGVTLTETLTGQFTHFATGTSTVSFGAGVTVNSVTATSSTTLQANITVQPTATLGPRNVSVTTGSEVVSLPNAFSVTVGPAAIPVGGLNPASGAQGNAYIVAVTGSQTHFASGVTTAAFGGGITVTGISVTDALHATVNIAIPTSTPVGAYNVTLTTGGESATILGGFTVTQGSPQLSVVNPPTGHQGDANLSVSLTGLNTHFANGTSTASFGAGITVNSLTVSDATDAVANITISLSATIGSRNVTITTGTETATLTGGFSVLVGVPHLVSANPASAQVGATVNVAIAGAFTTFQQGFSSVSFGSGITVNSITVTGLAQLSANITVTSNATVGSRDITVTTNSQTVTLSGGFTVTPGTPIVTQINPNIGVPGATAVTVTLNGQFTNWVNGTTTASFGPGISVSGAAEGASGPVTVANATTLTAVLTLDPSAAFGPRTVVVTTGSEVETVAAGFTVQPATVSPPTVVSVSPAAFAGGMPINSSIVVVFSQPMMRSTINTGNGLLYLTSNPGQGSIAVPGSVTLDASGLVMTLTPNAVLALNSQYELQLTSGVQDASGNQFAYNPWAGNGFIAYLNTTSTANTAVPTIVAANPPANSNPVGTNVTVQLEFSTEMDEATQAGLTVSSGGVTVAGTWSWNSNVYPYGYYWDDTGPGTILTFTPTSPLAANTTYKVSYGAPLADTAGNALTPGSFTFTTGSGADTATNSATADFNQWQSNLGTNFVPKVNFSKPVNPVDINSSTLYLYNYDSGKYLKGAVNVAPNGMSATFTPSVPLLPNTAYTFYMGWGSFDMDGNSLSGTYGYFTTGAGSDLAPPQVASVYPANATPSVPLNAQVVVHFSEAIDPQSAYSITLTPLGGSPIAGGATLASDQVTLTFSPASSLQANTQYTVQVSGYRDMVGNPGATFTSNFTTLNSVAPLNLSTGLDASGNLITTGGVPDPHWTVTPSGATSSQTAYVVAPGEAGWSPNWSPYGYADGPKSSVITLNPNAAQGSPHSTYSTAFNLSGYNLNNLCLVGAVQGDPYGTLLLNGNPITSQLYPWQGLAPIGISLQTAGVNQGANTLSYQFVSNWDNYEGFRLQASIQTCGASLTGGLSLVSAIPANGAASVTTNTTVTLTFNNPIDPATVNANTLQILIGQSTNQAVAGSYQVSGNQVVFTPESPFPVNTTIWVYAYGPSDTAGDSINGQWLTSFTTGAVAVAPPVPFQVMAFTPPANATNVGLRAPVVATFNRSVNPNTINQSGAKADLALFNDGSQSPWCQSYSKSQDNTTLQFTCYPLPSNSTITAMLNSNLQDWSGNALVNFTSQFTTMPVDSASGGTIASTRPGNGSSGIDPSQPLTLYASLPINPATVNAGLVVAQNNVAIAGTAQVLDNGYTLEFTPGSPWTQGALVQWWINGNLLDANFGNSFTSTNGYFYVAASTSTAAPTVQSISPPVDANIAPNAFFDIQFNTQLNPSTVNSSTIYLYDNNNGLNVSGTYSMPQPNVVRIVPAANLNANDYYFVEFTAGLQSSTSVPANPVGAWNDYWYTSSPIDSTAPAVLSAVPYNGASNVGVNVTPGVVFNKAIDPVSVNSNTFQVLNGATALAGGFWISSDDTRVEFVPNAPLPANTTLTMKLNGILDRVGNPVTFNSHFQTGAGPDVTVPAIVHASVGSYETIPVNSTITVQFSESMDVASFNSGNFFIEDTVLNVQVPATLTWSSDQTVAYLTPASPLAAGREYYLFVENGTDLAGNQLQSGYWYNQLYFYAGFSGASTAPKVVNFDPLNGATGLGTNTVVEAQFNAPIDPNSLAGVTLAANGVTVPTSPILSAGNTVLQVLPSTPLAPNTTYLLTIAGVKDPAGNQVNKATNSFTTGATFDINPPSVVNYDPPYNATVGTNVVPRMVFSKALNPITVSNSTFNMYLNDTGQWIPLAVTLSANGLEVTLQPQIPLLPNTKYYFQIGSYQDQDGNYGSGLTDYFNTGGGAASAGPTVTVSPSNGATGIPLNAQVLVTASALIDPTTWSQNSIQLLDSNNNPVAGTANLAGNGQMFTFVPTNWLLPGVTYTVNVSGFTDATGNAVVASKTTFMTGTVAGTGGLTLTSTNIPPGSTNVSATSPIVLTFSQILDPATVNASTLPVMTSWAGGTLAGSYTVSGNTITFTPTSPYPAGANIYVGECGGPTDVLGEVFYNGSCWQQQLTYFTVTTATPDKTPLQVVSVNPQNGATNVRHETPVSVTFNKSINPGTANVWTAQGYNQNAELYAGQTLQAWSSVTLSADNRTLTFNPGALHDGTTYTIALPAGGIADMSGNGLASDYISTFTTATNPAAGTGSVQATNPAQNASGIPTNTLLTLYMNRQVNANTLPGNLTVTVNGQIYAGTVTAQAGNYEIQFTPTVPFPSGATVQWFLTGNLLDVYGNDFSSDSGTFYTVATVNPATAAPQVVAISPAYGSGNVPTNAQIDIEYSLPIDPTTLSGNMFFSGGNTFTAGLAPGSTNIVRVTPNPSLSPASGYNFCANSGGVKGTNGVAAQTDCYWATSFTTISGPDTTSGTVKIGPPNGSVNVGTNAFIRLQFSKPVDITTINATTVQVTTGGNAISGTWTYNYVSGNVTGANFYPVNPLPPSSPIQVSVSGLLDYAGNTFTAATSQFTTAALPDFTNANIQVDFPQNQTGVATNASFTCRYSKPMDPSSITPSGVYVYSFVTNAAIPANYTFSSDLTSVTMTPKSPLYANAEYYYTCTGAIDLTGNVQSYNAPYYYYSWPNSAVFYTGNGPSSAGPVLVQANPPRGMTNVPVNTNNGPWYATSLGLLFNEPVAGDSLGNLTLTATPLGGGPTTTIPITAYPEYGNTILAVQLPYVLQPNTTYTYNVTGVTDYNGNPMIPTTSTFSTGSTFDWTSPTVISTNPANGANNVNVNTQSLSVTFSEAMDPVLIDSNNVYLQLHNTATPIPTTIGFSPDYTTVTLTPTAPLAAGTIYDLVVYANNWWPTDIAGNNMSAAGYSSYNSGYVFSTFTTNTPTAVNGACGTANGGLFSMPPTANLCSAGAASAITNPGSWTWTCNGEYGGGNASCSANVTLTSTPVPQPSGLVSWWPGNDNANDIVGGNNGTLENSAGFALGEVGDAFNFNGNDQYVLIGQPVPANLQIQNAITLSAWIYLTSYPASGSAYTIVGSADSSTTAGIGILVGGGTNGVGIPPGAIVFDIGNGSSWYTPATTTQVPLNQWVLVTAVASANQPGQIYFNGVLQPSFAPSNQAAIWNGTASYNGSWFAIGQMVSSNWPFTGLIDEVQVYNTALTAGQVQAIYNAGAAGMYTSQTASTTTVSSSASPSQVGDPVTFTASVSPSSATGAITFMDGGTALGTATLSGGQATLATSALALGVHRITALYSGNATYSGSVSPAINQIENLDGAECSPQPAGLIDWYPAEGNTNDIVGGNNGSVEGNVSYAPGVVGQAFDFTNSGEVSLTLPSLNTQLGSQFTVSFWMNWNGMNSVVPFGFPNYDLEMSGGSIGFNTNSGDIWGTSSSGLANQWVYVTAVFNNGNPRSSLLYFNGVQQTLSQVQGSSPNSIQAQSPAYIGGQGPGWSGWYFDGLIDEVQIFNRALTALEIQNIYQTGAAGVCQAQTSTTTTLQTSGSPTNPGSSVTFTASVSPSSATGTVTFLDWTTQLGPPATLSGGQATFTTSALTSGAHSITAVYDGDVNHAGSVSSALSQFVNLAPGMTVAPAVTIVPTRYFTNVESTNLGWEFTVNSPVTVWGLGYYDYTADSGLAGLSNSCCTAAPQTSGGLTETHQVGIYNSSGVLVTSATVPAGTAGILVNDFRYVSIAPAVTLAPGSYVIVATQENTGSEAATDPVVYTFSTFNTIPQITVPGGGSTYTWSGSYGALTYSPGTSGYQAYMGPNFQATAP